MLNLPQQKNYEFTVYDTKEISTNTISLEEAKNLDATSYDYFISSDFGILDFKRTDGNRCRYASADWPGLGDICLKIIQATQLNPGEFLTPREVSELTGRDTLTDSNNLAARWLAIRKSHKETFKRPNFFLSRRAGGYAIAWNPQKTWAWLERVKA